MSRASFNRYFPDKALGGQRKSLKAKEAALAELLSLPEGFRRVNGKLSATTILKAEKLLKNAV